MNKKRKEFTIVLLLSFFFGMLGAHRFYAKKIKTGLLMLFTLGGFGIWYLFDLGTILLGKFKNKKGKKLSF